MTGVQSCALPILCPAGLVLRCSSNVKADFINNRALADDETPTQVIISLHATRLPRDYYGACNAEAAVEALKELGYLKV